MKSKIILTLIAAILMVPAINIANVQAKGSHSDHEVMNVGNKICPVSGEKIGEMGDAHVVEYEGKSYNLCCKMCAKDFKKDPEKYIAKLEEMGMSEELSTETNHHEDSHDGHGDHDH